MRISKIPSWPTLFLILIICSSGSAGKLESKSTQDFASTKDIKPVTPAVDPHFAAVYKARKKSIQTAVSDYFKKALRKGQIAGAGVSIVNGDSIVFAAGFGKKNSKHGTLINANTAFRLGSLSKGFAGVLAGIYVNKDLLHWDDKLVDYVPEFRLGSAENTSKITLSSILSQSSGTPYHSYTNLVEAGLPLSEIAARFKNIEPISKPGELYSYQNAIYALSGTMMEKTSGLSLGTALQQDIFEPLGMRSSTTNYQDFTANSNIAYPHYRSYKGWRPKQINKKYFNAIAAGGINSSARDMARWMRFLLGHNPEVANNEVLKQVFAPKVAINGHSHYYQRWAGHISSHYAYGWRVHEYLEEESGEARIMAHHGGAVSGYRNEIALFPSEDLGICVLFNSHTSLASKVIPELHEIIKNILSKPENAEANKLIASL